jgi:hypothetical protein
MALGLAYGRPCDGGRPDAAAPEAPPLPAAGTAVTCGVTGGAPMPHV